jgi:hypothetical protein
MHALAHGGCMRDAGVSVYLQSLHWSATLSEELAKHQIWFWYQQCHWWCPAAHTPVWICRVCSKAHMCVMRRVCGVRRSCLHSCVWDISACMQWLAVYVCTRKWPTCVGCGLTGWFPQSSEGLQTSSPWCVDTVNVCVKGGRGKRAGWGYANRGSLGQGGRAGQLKECWCCTAVFYMTCQM